MITLGGRFQTTGLLKYILIGSIDDRNFLIQKIREYNTQYEEKIVECKIKIKDDDYQNIQKIGAGKILLVDNSFTIKVEII